MTAGIENWTIAAKAIAGQRSDRLTSIDQLLSELDVQVWQRQREVLQAAIRGDREIAVKSGHAVGKTFVAALAVIWWLRSGGPGTIVITSAPTNRQVEHLLWREIRRLWPRSRTNRMLAQPRRRFIEIDKNWAAYGFSTDEPQRFQGWHAPRLRVLIDEANGFPEPLFEVIDACLTGADSQLLMIGNPIAPVGRFWRAFSDPNVTKITISSREHPNVQTGRVVVPGAVTREWIEDFERRYGNDEDTIRARIDGEFPRSTDRGLVSLDAIQRCAETVAMTRSPVVLAIDVARYGEAQTVLTRLEGQHLAWQRAWSKMSLADTSRKIIRLLEDDPVDFIVVDDTGIGGGVTDMLRDHGIEVVAFSGGERAIDHARYYNRASEAWGIMRDLIEEQVLAIHPITVDYDALVQQLTTRVLKPTSTGRMRIEPKDEYAQRTGLRSPDHADSLAMACWQVARIWARELS